MIVFLRCLSCKEEEMHNFTESIQSWHDIKSFVYVYSYIKEWLTMGRAHASSKLIKASDTPWIILRYIHTSISKNINNRYSNPLTKSQTSLLTECTVLMFNVTKWINLEGLAQFMGFAEVYGFISHQDIHKSWCLYLLSLIMHARKSVEENSSSSRPNLPSGNIGWTIMIGE